MERRVLARVAAGRDKETGEEGIHASAMLGVTGSQMRGSHGECMVTVQGGSRCHGRSVNRRGRDCTCPGRRLCHDGPSVLYLYPRAFLLRVQEFRDLVWAPHFCAGSHGFGA